MTGASRACAAPLAGAACPVKIRLTLDGALLATATLDDNHSARDFATLLPIALTLKDYADTEKIADLPRALSTQGAPEGYMPSEGDISFYAPWGNLAIFHQRFEYSEGLVRLGRLSTGVDAMRRVGALAVRIDIADPLNSDAA